MGLNRAMMAQSELTITATSVAPQTASAYIFSFVADQEISPRAALAIVFPSAYDLSQVVLVDSRTLDGGLEVRVRQDTVWALRSGRGKSIVAGTRVDLIFAAVLKTASGSDGSQFVLLHRNETGALRQSSQRADVNLRKSDRL